jgi:hypothetical protein
MDDHGKEVSSSVSGGEVCPYTDPAGRDLVRGIDVTDVDKLGRWIAATRDAVAAHHNRGRNDHPATASLVARPENAFRANAACGVAAIQGLIPEGSQDVGALWLRDVPKGTAAILREENFNLELVNRHEPADPLDTSDEALRSVLHFYSGGNDSKQDRRIEMADRSLKGLFPEGTHWYKDEPESRRAPVINLYHRALNPSEKWIRGTVGGYFLSVAKLVSAPLEEGATASENGTHLCIRSMEPEENNISISVEIRQTACNLAPVPPEGFNGSNPSASYSSPVLYLPAVPMALLLTVGEPDREFCSLQTQFQRWSMRIEMPEAEMERGIFFTPSVLRGAQLVLCAAVPSGLFTALFPDVPMKSSPESPGHAEVANAIQRDPRWMDLAWAHGVADEMADAALQILKDTRLPLPESVVATAAIKAKPSDYVVLRSHALSAGFTDSESLHLEPRPGRLLWQRAGALPDFDWRLLVRERWTHTFAESGSDDKLPPDLRDFAALAGDADALNSLLEAMVISPNDSATHLTSSDWNELANMIEGIPAAIDARPAWFRDNRGYFTWDEAVRKYRVLPHAN